MGHDGLIYGSGFDFRWVLMGFGVGICYGF